MNTGAASSNSADLVGAQDAGRHREHQRKSLAQQHQLNRHRKPVDYRIQDRHLRDEGAAEVAVDETGQPMQEAQHQRLIEAEFGTHLRYCSWRRLIAEQSERHVARQQVQEQESRRGD